MKVDGRARAAEATRRSSVVGSRKPEQSAFIRTTATRLFERRGYHATTMDDIAAEVKLNKATVYHYFASKNELLLEIYSSGIDDILARFASQPTGDTASATLRRIVHDIVEAMADNQSRTAVYYQERPFIEIWFPPEACMALRAKERAYASHVQRVIERGVFEGEFTCRDAAGMAFTVLAAAGQTYQWYRPSGSLTVGEIGDLISDAILNGLVANRE